MQKHQIPSQIKSMAAKILSVVSKDNGIREMQVLLDKLTAEYEKSKNLNETLSERITVKPHPFGI